MKPESKPKVEVKKLAVRKSALRELNAQDLEKAVGGTINASGKCMGLTF